LNAASLLNVKWCEMCIFLIVSVLRHYVAGIAGRRLAACMFRRRIIRCPESYGSASCSVVMHFVCSGLKQSVCPVARTGSFDATNRFIRLHEPVLLPVGRCDVCFVTMGGIFERRQVPCPRCTVAAIAHHCVLEDGVRLLRPLSGDFHLLVAEEEESVCLGLNGRNVLIQNIPAADLSAAGIFMRGMSV